jgi:hypothetical protein
VTNATILPRYMGFPEKIRRTVNQFFMFFSMTYVVNIE